MAARNMRVLLTPRMALSGSSQEASAAASVGARSFSATIPYPKTPYRKGLLERSKQAPPRPWIGWMDPRMIAKNIRAGERRARELGVIEDLRKFDEAAAAFPKPPAIMAAALVERPELIFRDLEDWEADFLEMQFEHEQSTARKYPPELLSMFTASQTVMEGKEGEAAGAAAAGGKKGGAAAADKKEAAEKEGGEGAPAAGSSAAASSSSGGGDDAAAVSAAAAAAANRALSSFYVGSGDDASRSSNKTDEAAAGITASPRESSADTIGDLRSLDRAYSQRLILLAKSKQDGSWGLPAVEVLGDQEAMVEAADRAVRTCFGNDGELELWFPGAAPVGHQLVVFSPEKQALTGRYGAKLFVYRCQIFNGRLRVHNQVEAGAFVAASAKRGHVDDGASYSDFHWLTRDETEGFLSRESYKYYHQVMGAGAGEEYARRMKWRAKIEAKGLTVDQASGRRNYRVQQGKAQSLRWHAVATRDHAAVAAQPFDAEGKKLAAIAAEGKEFSKRFSEQRRISAGIKLQLQPLTAAKKAALAREERNKTAAAGAAGAAAGAGGAKQQQKAALA